jgi:hypothetical protein
MTARNHYISWRKTLEKPLKKNMEKPLKNPWFHGWSTGLGSTLAFGIQLLEMAMDAMDAMEREMVKPGFRIFP